MFKIMVIEDDVQLNHAICTFLRQQGYIVSGCLNAEEAYNTMYVNIFDLIISDIMMPGTDGFEFVRNVRRQNEEVPIIFITARDDIIAKQLGFRLGVDDYMVKPIDFEELALRIGALFRRAKISASKKIVVGNLTLDADEHTGYIDGKQISLSVREFNLIYKFLSYPKKPFTRSQLMDEFWDNDSSSSQRTVDVYIVKLREKFADCDGFEIKTVHGLGYKAVIKDEANK